EGETSVDTALAYSNIAEVHRIAGRYDRALPLYRKSRAIYTKILGDQHPRVAALLSQEGLILMIQGKLGLADESMQHALEAVSKSCPECASELWVCESNLGLLRFRQGKLDEADRLLSAALELQYKCLTKPG